VLTFFDRPPLAFSTGLDRRTSDTFKQGVGRLRAMLDDFVAHTMDIAAKIE